jgi:hypothetical protein
MKILGKQSLVAVVAGFRPFQSWGRETFSNVAAGRESRPKFADTRQRRISG